MMTELTEYAPTAKMKQATYRAGTFIVDGAMAKPTMAVVSPAVMCHVRSCMRPELQPQRIPAAPATMNGGQVRTRVIVVSKPIVLMTLCVCISTCSPLTSSSRMGR